MAHKKRWKINMIAIVWGRQLFYLYLLWTHFILFFNKLHWIWIKWRELMIYIWKDIFVGQYLLVGTCWETHLNISIRSCKWSSSKYFLSVFQCLTLYWVTSSFIGLSQNLLFLSPSFRRVVGIPPNPSTRTHPYSHLMQQIREKFGR